MSPPHARLLAALVAAAPLGALHGQCLDPQPDTVFATSGDSLMMRLATWRDFMPAMPPRRTHDGGSPLQVWIVVQTLGPRPARVPVAVHGVWTRLDAGWFAIPFDSVRMQPDSAGFETMARGPEWRTDSRIDVAVEWRAADEPPRCTQLRRVIRRLR